MATRQLARGLERRMLIDHIDRGGEVRRDVLTIRTLSEYFTEGGLQRIRLRVAGTPDFKTILSHRIRAFEDPDTGERVEDVNGYLAEEIDRVHGTLPDTWPDPSANRMMTTEIDITFSSDGFAEDFVFGVRLPFRKALDIQRVSYDKGRRRRWMRGVPPLFSFEAGDRFESPPTLRTDTNAERNNWRQTAHVESACPDTLDANGVRCSGWVTATVTAYVDGEAAGRDHISTSQAGFAEFLRTGAPPPHIEPSQKEPTSTTQQPDTEEASEDFDIFAIDYCDSKGHMTRRRIIVRSVEDIGLDLVIHATCIERHAARTFYGSRVRTVFDPETGEILGDPRVALSRFIVQDA